MRRKFNEKLLDIEVSFAKILATKSGALIINRKKKWNAKKFEKSGKGAQYVSKETTGKENFKNYNRGE